MQMAAAIVITVMYMWPVRARALGTSSGIVGTEWAGHPGGARGQTVGICLFDTKSSVRKENKQPGVLLPWRQRKSSYSSTTQYLQCRSDAHQHTRRHMNLHAFGDTHICVGKQVLGVKPALDQF